MRDTGILIGLAVAVLTMACLALLPDVSASLGKIWRRRRRLGRLRRRRQILAELKAFGFLLRTNTREHITAVCRGSDFRWLLLEKYKEDSKWKKLPFAVHPTFAFCEKEESHGPAIVGTREDLDAIIGDLAWELLRKKYPREMFKGKLLGDCAKILIKRNERLYVPFVGDAYKPEWKPYENVTLELARHVLVAEVVREAKHPAPFSFEK